MTELDETTIRKAMNKDSSAFGRLYDHYNSFVWKVVYRTVNGDMESARQIMQDTFLKAYYSLKSYRFQSALSTWLYRIAFTTSLNHLRAKKGWLRRFGSLDEKRVAAAKSARLDERDMVSRLLASLAPEQRFLLVAREVDGVPFEELEELTGKSSGALRTQLSRLKESLRKEFGDEFGQ